MLLSQTDNSFIIDYWNYYSDSVCLLIFALRQNKVPFDSYTDRIC